MEAHAEHTLAATCTTGLTCICREKEEGDCNGLASQQQMLQT